MRLLIEIHDSQAKVVITCDEGSQRWRFSCRWKRNVDKALSNGRSVLSITAVVVHQVNGPDDVEKWCWCLVHYLYWLIALLPMRTGSNEGWRLPGFSFCIHRLYWATKGGSHNRRLFYVIYGPLTFKYWQFAITVKPWVFWWCSADVGWITGHSVISLYGIRIISMGASQKIFFEVYHDLSWTYVGILPQKCWIRNIKSNYASPPYSANSNTCSGY